MILNSVSQFSGIRRFSTVLTGRGCIAPCLVSRGHPSICGLGSRVFLLWVSEYLRAGQSGFSPGVGSIHDHWSQAHFSVHSIYKNPSTFDSEDPLSRRHPSSNLINSIWLQARYNPHSNQSDPKKEQQPELCLTFQMLFNSQFKQEKM